MIKTLYSSEHTNRIEVIRRNSFKIDRKTALLQAGLPWEFTILLRIVSLYLLLQPVELRYARCINRSGPELYVMEKRYGLKVLWSCLGYNVVKSRR